MGTAPRIFVPGDHVTFAIGEHAGFGVVETVGDHYVYVRLPETFSNGLPVFEAVRPDEVISANGVMI